MNRIATCILLSQALTLIGCTSKKPEIAEVPPISIVSQSIFLNKDSQFAKRIKWSTPKLSKEPLARVEKGIVVARSFESDQKFLDLEWEHKLKARLNSQTISTPGAIIQFKFTPQEHNFKAGEKIELINAIKGGQSFHGQVLSTQPYNLAGLIQVLVQTTEHTSDIMVGDYFWFVERDLKLPIYEIKNKSILYLFDEEYILVLKNNNTIIPTHVSVLKQSSSETIVLGHLSIQDQLIDEGAILLKPLVSELVQSVE